MKEAVKSGGKGGNLKTLSNSNIKVGGNNLLLPGTKKEDVANSSAGEASKVATSSTDDKGPIVKEEKAPASEAGRGPGDKMAGAPGTKTAGSGPGANGPVGGPMGGPQDGRGPASIDGKGSPGEFGGPEAGGDCPLSGCGGLTGIEGPAGFESDFAMDGPILEDPCILDPGLCEVAPLDGDICASNPQLPQCGGSAGSSTNVQFNFSTQ
jgi:hypothetical protein